METKNRSVTRGIFRALLPAIALVVPMNTAGYAAANSTTSGGSLAETPWGAPLTNLAEPAQCPEGTDGGWVSCGDNNWLQKQGHGSPADDFPSNDEIEIYLSARELLDKDHMVYTSPAKSGISSVVVVTEPRTRGFRLGVQFRLEYSF